MYMIVSLEALSSIFSKSQQRLRSLILARLQPAPAVLVTPGGAPLALRYLLIAGLPQPPPPPHHLPSFILLLLLSIKPVVAAVAVVLLPLLLPSPLLLLPHHHQRLRLYQAVC